MNKTIYTYWDSIELPLFNKLCMESWKKTNGDYDIVLLNKNNFKDYIKHIPEGFDKLIVQHQSDYIRLYLLYFYGGVWLDNTILLLDTLDKLIDITSNKLQCFRCYFNGDKIVENSIICCPKGNNYMKIWLSLYTKAITIGFTTFYDLNKNKYHLIYKDYDYLSSIYLTNMIIFGMIYMNNQHINNDVIVYERKLINYDPRRFFLKRRYQHNMFINFTRINLQDMFIKFTSCNRNEFLNIIKNRPVINKTILNIVDLNRLRESQ